MKYAIAIRNMGPQSTRETIRACARVAEQIGFDALFVSDHLCIPPDQGTRQQRRCKPAR